MIFLRRVVWVALTLSVFATAGRAAPRTVEFALRSRRAGLHGEISVTRGKLVSFDSEATTEGNRFSTANAVLLVTVECDEGPLPTLVTVASPLFRTFTFDIAQIEAGFVVYLPREQIVVIEGAAALAYEEIVQLDLNGGTTKLAAIEEAPEMTFEQAAAAVRDIKVETWLGIGRDMRLFRVDERMETFQPRFAGYETKIPETPRQASTYALRYGRGWGPRVTLKRSLDDGALPILRGVLDDEDVRYEVVMFASLEKSLLMPENVRGTDYLVADAHGHGHMFTPAQAEQEKQRREGEMNPAEEIVLHARVVATNRGNAPRHAFLNTVVPSLATPVSPRLPEWKYDSATGMSGYDSGRVFATARLGGHPAPAEENSVLLRPGSSVTLDVVVPHRPIERERALALAAADFDERLVAARLYWRAKLASASQWSLPEPRIDRMVKAGLLHLDLVLYGRQPPEPLLPAIGIYTAIGSESAPIIQTLDSMGRHDDAARAIDFFLAKQHDSGFMQNFNGYMLETGAVLWTMGEHFRYTRDAAWRDRVTPQLVKAAEYLIAWRERNLQPEMQGRGYGMLDGKTADPEDPYRSFMLNGYAYLGLARAAEMLADSSPAQSERFRHHANALKDDIRRELEHATGQSPVIPLGDRTWVRSTPPWTNYRGPVMLHADGGRWFTHGSITSRDSLLGPLYLVFQEVVAPDEPVTTDLLLAHSELMTRDNVAFSQPYYSRHPWIHLQRGETKAFLAAWYGSVASLADRETYTFSEHFFPASSHKTHEEAWFLMETRWMLYLEQGETLHLLRGIPRSYLQPGRSVGVRNAASYFGTLDFSAVSAPDGKQIRIAIRCDPARAPKTVEFRVPHPANLRATSVTNGIYHPESETLRFDNFNGTAEAVLSFSP